MSNSTETQALPPPAEDFLHLGHHDTGKVGMIAFLTTEVAFFGTLIVTYITYIGKSHIGPYPADAFKMWQVVLSTACLLSSSFTVHLATKALYQGAIVHFRRWWMITMALGLLFLFGTAIEWHDLIFKQGLTPARNVFGTTYFTLVGFHALHVSIGLFIMSLVLGMAFRVPRHHDWPLNAELVSWYWHFVDAVWVVVFTVVYLIGR